MFENIATPEAPNTSATCGFVHKCSICRDPIEPEGRADLLKSQDRPLLCLWCGEQNVPRRAFKLVRTNTTQARPDVFHR